MEHGGATSTSPEGVRHVQRAIGQYGGTTWEKDTKNEEDRRIVLDPETVLVLSERRDRCVARAVALGIDLAGDAFVFSRDADGRGHLKRSANGRSPDGCANERS